MTEEQLQDANKYIESIGIENVQNITITTSKATNGNIIKSMFPNLRVEDGGNSIYLHYPDGWIAVFEKDWWDALYTWKAER